MKKKAVYSAAYSPDGTIALVHNISATGPFRCIGCGKPMIARRGEERIWHFAHSNDGRCSGETALHKAAKEMIAGALRRSLEINPHPAFLASYKCPYCRDTHAIDLIVETGEIEVETQIGPVIPDILLKDTSGSPHAVIEVVVSHAPEDTAISYYMGEWNKPVYVVSPTWEELPDIIDRITLSAILAGAHTCPARRSLMERHARAFAICGRIPSTTDDPRAQCQACGSVLFPFALEVLADYSCYNCGCTTPIATIQPESEEADEIPSRKRLTLATILRSDWHIDIRLDYSHTVRSRYLMNHCRHCRAKIGDFYIHEALGTATVVDHRELGYCDNCGTWLVGSSHIRSPYLFGECPDIVDIPEQLRAYGLSLRKKAK